MLLTLINEYGEDRLYATRHTSVVTYFTADTSDTGVVLHVEPGYFAIPQIYARVSEDVRHAVLADVAARLGIAVHQVCSVPMRTLCKYADPDVPEYYRYAKRPRGRSKPLNRSF